MTAVRKPPRPEGFNFDESLLAFVAAAYGFERIESLRPLLLDGEYVTLVDVRSDTARKMPFSAGGARWFLKEIPWYCDDATLAFSHTWQSALHRAGIPVPHLRSTVDGGTWARLDGVRLVVSSHEDGRRFRGARQESEAAAAMLARIHLVPLDTPGGPTGDAFATAMAHIDLASETGTLDDAGVRQYREAVSAWKDEADALGATSLPAGGVHGDYSQWNLLFGGPAARDADVAAVLDFDNAHRGPVLRDLVEALLTFGSVRYRADSTRFASALPGPLPAGSESMLAAYSSVRPLEPCELRCAGAFAGAVAIELACLGLIRGDYTMAQAPGLLRWASAVAGQTRDLVEAGR